MFKLFIWTEGNKTKILALVSLDLDKRAKSNDTLFPDNQLEHGFDNLKFGFK